MTGQEDSFSGNESGGVRKSGSRSRFLKKVKSKEVIAGYKDPDNISNFDSQARESNDYNSVRSSFVSKKTLNKNRVIDDEIITIEESSLKNPIDDIPIPVSNKGPKTFDQLLEEELAREAKANGKEEKLDGSDIKKSFLKRKNEKSGSKVQSTAKKAYKYYIDNFKGATDTNKMEEEDCKIPLKIQKSRNSVGKNLVSEGSQGMNS